MNDEKISELEAMIIHLTKRIENLEGTSRIASVNIYLNELKREAQKIIRFWG